MFQSNTSNSIVFFSTLPFKKIFKLSYHFSSERRDGRTIKITSVKKIWALNEIKVYNLINL